VKSDVILGKTKIEVTSMLSSWVIWLIFTSASSMVLDLR